MIVISVLVCIIGGLIISQLVQFWISRSKLVEKSKNIQWAHGSGLSILIKCMGSNSQDIFRELTILYSHCLDIRKLFLGPQLFVLISKPEYMETILNHSAALDKADFYKFFRPLFGTGIFTISASSDSWRRHRKMIAPFFNRRYIENHVGVMAKHARLLAEKCQKGAQDEEHFAGKITNCIMDIISETFFVSESYMQKNDSHFSKTFDEVFHIIFCRALKFWYYPDFTFKWFSSMYPAQKENLSEINSYVSEVIHDKTKEYLEQDQVDDETADTGGSFIRKIIERCYKESDYTEQGVHDEIKTMLIASVDTTTTTFCFLLMCLGMEKNVQNSVYEEIVNVMGANGDIIDAESLSKLAYTERVIKESLRIFPTGPYVGRELTSDVEIGDDKTIPASAQVVLSILSVHRNPEYWPDPLKFDPDRFLPEEVSKRPSCHFLPFSGGPRNCVGWQWGMVALKTLLVATLRKFKLKSTYRNVEEVGLYSHLLLRTTDGFKIILECR